MAPTTLGSTSGADQDARATGYLLQPGDVAAANPPR
jgi:hypothetical protein